MAAGNTAVTRTSLGRQAVITTALILAAGRGSRLAPLTDDIPKPLLDVHGQPLIVHQLQWLKSAGITRVVINLFHLGQQIRSELGNGRAFDLDIVYSEEPQLLETGGAIAHARQLLGEAPFVLLNGDIWTDFNFLHLPTNLSEHLLGHLLVTPTPVNRDEGDLAFIHHRVRRPRQIRNRRWVYCGIALVKAAIVGKQTGVFSLRDSLFAAAERGQLAGQAFHGQWTDIGTLDQLNALRHNR